jgi:glycosyltransferase involved in cell wall biosynthesis
MTDGATDAVARAARLSLAADPAAVPALCQLGQALLAMGDPDGAGRAFRAALAHTPGQPQASEGAVRAAVTRQIAAAAQAPGAPEGLVVLGPFRDTSGFSYMVRRFVGEFIDLGQRVLLAGQPWGPRLDEGQRDPRLDRLGLPLRARAAVHFNLPDFVMPVPGLLTINVAMTELSRVPASWVERARWHDLVVVPTEASRLAWIDSGLDPGRIALCPLGCDPLPAERAAAVPDLRTLSGRAVGDYRCRFLNISSFTVRKNLGGLLRVWGAATRRDDDAVLVLKLGKGEDDDEVRDAFALLLERNGLDRRTMAEVVLVTGKLSDTDMTGLFGLASHYVSLSRGEGWDLPMARAGALGLGLVAPDHTAFRTYLDAGVAHLVPARPVLVQGVAGAAGGAGWWEPDEAAAAGIVRAIVHGTAAPRRSPAPHLLERFSWRRAAGRLLALVAGAVAAGPAQRPG